MPRFFVKTNQIIQNNIIINNEDVKHIKNVLRKDIGDILEICNQETGIIYKCKIDKISEHEIITNIINKENNNEDKIKVDIFQGLPKFDKMELIIQKSIELGANSITPVEMKRCVAKIDTKTESKKIERWQKIAESAAKQSGRNKIPKINNIIKIEDILKMKDLYDIILVCYENENKNPIKNELLKIKNQEKANIAVIIGPEGGLEEKDVETLKQKDAKIVTLGNRILRTETVALNVLSIIMYELEN